MKRNLFLTSLVTLALGVTVLPASAQVTTTTTTTVDPVMTQTQAYPGLSGQVTQTGPSEAVDGGLFTDTIYKSITLQPGQSQFTFDTLNWQDRVMLTLVNPTNMPLQFETTQRWGEELKTVVPANSQQVVEFRFGRPIADEVKFTVFEAPQSALERISQNLTGQTQAQAIEAQPVDTMTSEEVVPVQPVQQQVESQSAVRGYW